MRTVLHRRRGPAPPCDHLFQVRCVTPHSQGCLVCLDRGRRWLGLCLCLTCGWVACSDDSAGHHARDHYEETDHPVSVRLPEEQGPRWCYVHERVI
jgi:uncharacterized UBP type Zn finger protein